MPTKDYQTDLLKRLANADYAAQYLKVAFDEALVDGNKSAFLLALKNVIDANGGMKTLENDAQIPPQHLEQIFNNKKNTNLEALTSVLRSVGMTIDFKPLVPKQVTAL